MSKKVLVTPRSFGKTSRVPFEMLEKLGYEVIVNKTGKQLSEDELVEAVRDIDGLIVGLDPVTDRVLRAAKNLKVVSKYGVGTDNIDKASARELGIAVTYTPGANNESVADFAFSLMLGSARSIGKLDAVVRSGRWEKIIGTEVYGKTIGIIGTGAIGKGVAKRATGFDMNVLAFDIYPDQAFADKIGMKYVDKETLLREADFISLHVPLTKEMHHFIGREEFAIMKKTAFIINTSRGGIVNESELYDALKDKVIAGAALDVFEVEPPLGNRLLELDNILLAPHCGASTTDATDRMGVMAVEGLASILEGQEPKYLAR